MKVVFDPLTIRKLQVSVEFVNDQQASKDIACFKATLKKVKFLNFC